MSQETPPTIETPKSRSTGIRFLLVLLWRLILLGGGGGLAWVLGMVFVTFYRNPNPEPPLVAKLLGHVPTQTSADSSSLSSASAVPVTSPASQLSAAQKKQLTTQLTQLQTQLDQLRNQTTALETELGSRRPNEPLEKRLQILSQQLQGKSTPSTEATLPLLQSDALKVTLPSDVLFDENNILRSEASLILDKVISDLRNYQKATIHIGAHTDGTNEAPSKRALSFRQAQVVEEYLSSALGKQYHWVVIGYGESRPLVENDNEANRQRNRRIEIAIRP